MSSVLCLSVRFLSPYSHGRGAGREPEWPPSPLRLFQTLVAAAAARWNEPTAVRHAVPALGWLAGLPAPTVVACAGTPAEGGYRLYVPDNLGDLVARAWSGGRSDDIARYRTGKDVRAVLLGGDAAVHYLYPLSDGRHEPHLGTLTAAARAVSHLGWGVDMVVGDAAVISSDKANALPGERWRPTADGAGTPFRVPRPDTLAALRERHAAFLARLASGGFSPVPPLAVFDTVGYLRDSDPTPRSVAAFVLRTPGFDHPQTFDPCNGIAAVSGMVRHAAAGLAAATRPFGWSDADVNTLVHGHTPDGNGKLSGSGADDRFAFLPLPVVERGTAGEVVGEVGRVLVVAPPGRPAAARWAKLLSGQSLTPLAGTRPAALQLVDPPAADRSVSRYLRPARVWSTVTPVLRPGYDDRNPAKSDKLLRRAFEQAGYSQFLVERAEFEWRTTGFLPGVRHVCRFSPPAGLAGFAKVHVRVTWPTPVPGPVAVGAGRYRGFGVFISEGSF